MSQDECYYLPITPPGVARMPLMGSGLGPAGPGSAHSRNTSGSSVQSCHGSSPESMMTNMTTPPTSISPNHQHGPQLLPKIRTQDVVLEAVSNAVGPRRHRRVLSNTRNPPGYMPYPTARHASGLSRNVVDAASAGDCNGLISPISPHHPSSLASSGLSSPIALTTAGSGVPSVAHKRRSMPAAGGHSRSASTSSIDEVTLSRYGYPTYRQLPKYVSQSEASPISPIDPASFVFPTYRPIPSVQVPCSVQLASQQTAYSALPSPQNYDYLRVQSAQPSPVLFLAPPAPTSPSPSTTLLTYLTKTTPAVNLVRTVNYGPTRGLNDYFWWDIRQLRSWSSFSLNTFNDISGLTQLLKTPIPSHLTPHPPAISSSRLTPESENALISLVGDIYAPRINAALRVSQGSDHMKLYVSPEANAAGGKGANGPHFLANYASDTEVTASGSRRGRVVGIVKSFDRWNTGMRNDPPHRRVEYLRGLAHLQRCMREHSCRYGFMITEIELVCVRAGCDEGDDVPYFGYLELSSPIATRESASETLASHSFPSPSSSSSSSLSASSSSPSSRENKKRRRSSTPPLSHCSTSSSTSSSLDETRSAHSRSSSLASVGSRISSGEHGSDGLVGVPLTATLALYFLLMLSKSMPLPSQPSGHLNVGGPGALSRQRILPEPKDKWIPEPQLGEKREAKRVRGWIMPQDAWHRREGSRPKAVSGTKKSSSGGESGKARVKRSKQSMTCS